VRNAVVVFGAADYLARPDVAASVPVLLIHSLF
jgi:hypothetical protein